jgi:oligopeptide transport system substrate-binding protein
VATAAAALAFAASCGAPDRADLVVGNGPEIESFDPAIGSDVASLRILSALFEGLTELDPETAAPRPALATAVGVSEDGLDVTFTLPADARFSDGSPLRSSDVLFAWRRVQLPATGSSWAGLLREVVRLEAPDDRTFRVRLERPDPALLAAASLPALAPLPADQVAAAGDAFFSEEKLVSNGPYRLKDFRLRDRTRVEKNPHYRGAGGVSIDTVDFLAADDARTLAAFYFQGDADWVTSVPPELAPRLAGRTDYRVGPLLGTYLFRLNVTRAPLDDPRVRLALSLSLDREALVRTIVRGGEKMASSLVPRELPGYRGPAGVTHDPARARELLAEAGHPGGRGLLPFEIVFNGTEENRAIAAEVQAAWKRTLGVDVTLRVLEMKSLLASTRRLDYAIARGSWIADIPDAIDFLRVFRGDEPNNRTGWRDDRYDALLSEASTESNPVRRAALLSLAESILLEAAPVIPVYHYASRHLVSPRIEGFIENPLDRHSLSTLRMAVSE